TPTTLYTLSLHDALPIFCRAAGEGAHRDPSRLLPDVHRRRQVASCRREMDAMDRWFSWRDDVAVFPPQSQAFLAREGRALFKARSEEHTSELQSRGHLVC